MMMMERINTMRKLFSRKLIAGLAVLIGLSTLAYGLTVPPSISPRRVPWQTTTHYRWTINFNDVGSTVVGGAAKIGAVPAKAFVSRIYCYVTNVWQNGAGNNFLGLASTSAGTAAGVGDWLNGATGTTSSCVLTTAGYQPITTAVGLGLAVTSPATPTGSSGGFDIFYKLYSSAGTPTVGQVTVVFEYVPDDDM